MANKCLSWAGVAGDLAVSAPSDLDARISAQAGKVADLTIQIAGLDSVFGPIR